MKIINKQMINLKNRIKIPPIDIKTYAIHILNIQKEENFYKTFKALIVIVTELPSVEAFILISLFVLFTNFKS